MKFVAPVALMSVFLFGCASGTVSLVNPPRDPIDVAQVKIYREAPETYEVIGIVEAYSDAGASKKTIESNALKEIKKQAAKIGANGVIISSVDEEEFSYKIPTTGGFYGPGGGASVSGSKTGIAVSGEAIYVPD